jgi:hypothetical protein
LAKKNGSDRWPGHRVLVDEALYRPIVLSSGCNRHDICGRQQHPPPRKSGPNLDDTCTNCEIVNHVINCVQLLRCQFACFGPKGAPSASDGGPDMIRGFRMMINAPLMEYFPIFSPEATGSAAEGNQMALRFRRPLPHRCKVDGHVSTCEMCRGF